MDNKYLNFKGGGFTPLERRRNARGKSNFLTGFTLVGVILTVSIITLLATIVIPQFLRRAMIDNETSARATLKSISTALEAYAAQSEQGYVSDISVLTTTNPSYLTKNYVADSPILGYNYTCDLLEFTGYSCSATPQHCGQTGSKIYTITTGGVFIERDCNQ